MIIDGKFYGRIRQKNLLGSWRCPWCYRQIFPQYLRMSDKMGEIKWNGLKPICGGTLIKWCRRGNHSYETRCNKPMDYMESGLLKGYIYTDIEAFIEDHKGDLL